MNRNHLGLSICLLVVVSIAIVVSCQTYGSAMALTLSFDTDCDYYCNISWVEFKLVVYS